MKEKYISQNITLIGMPGSGKSTVGVLLAKAAGLSFTDTDLLIQNIHERLLQEIIDTDGIQKFLEYEQEIILSFFPHKCVIATGGSAVLSSFAMHHLKKISVIVYLKTDFNCLKKRIHTITGRGIVMGKDQTLSDVYMEREPLYEKYADITVDGGKNPEQVIGEIAKAIE